jgi:hypothetical protein
MKIRPVEAEMFHERGRTDRHDEAIAPKNETHPKDFDHEEQTVNGCTTRRHIVCTEFQVHVTESTLMKQADSLLGQGQNLHRDCSKTVNWPNMLRGMR